MVQQGVEVYQEAECGLFISSGGRNGHGYRSLLPRVLWLMTRESSQEMVKITTKTFVVASERQTGRLRPPNCTTC